MEIQKDKLLIIGAGGHGRVVFDIAKSLCKYLEIAFLDDDFKKNCNDYRVVGKIDDYPKFINNCDFIVALGDGGVRKKISEMLVSSGANLVSLIHPQSVIGSNVTIEDGCAVMAGVVVNCGTIVKKGSILNTSSSVDHDCSIGEYCHISVGSHICGTVSIGDMTWIGAGATISNNINICTKCMIGAGTVVIKDIIEAGTYVGVPARKIN